MMDLKGTGKAWVGNLKQKVGAVRQEVDNIMSQESVKYVGNQVQTVGKSMKWLYTGIVDVRPSAVYPAKCQPEGAACKNGDVRTNVNVKVGVPRSLVDTDDKLLHEGPVSSAHLMTKGTDDCQVKLNHFDVKPDSQTYVNLINGEWPNLARGNKEMVLTGKLLDEDNLKEKKAPLSFCASKLMTPDEEECSVSRLNTAGDEPFGRFLGHESVGVDDKHRILNMERILAESLDSDGKFLTEEKVTVSNTFMDDIESPCDDSRVSTHTKLNALISCCENRMTKEVLGSPVLDGKFPPQKELTCQNRIYDLNHVCGALKAYTPLEPTSTLACEENLKGEGIDSSGSVYEGAFLCGQSIGAMNNFADDSTWPTSFTSPFIQLNKGFSTELHDQGTVEKMVDLSSFPSLKGHQAFVYPPRELSAKECKPIVKSGFVFSDSFTISSATVLPSVENKIHESFVSESPHKESLSEEQEVADMLPSGPTTESLDDISMSSMETIELSEKEKLESGRVIVDNTTLHTVSSTWRKFSYKEMIQNAFTSRKRLAKEYKQLGIQFGDADIWQDQDSFETTLPSSTSCCKSIETDVTHDSEWEII